MSMFSDLVEEAMDDYSNYVSSFEHCLKNLEIVFQRCQDKNLTLNWENFHFMVIEAIVMVHKIFCSWARS